MGQYKVPQDVEAEDKIIGFMTLKQFIYAVVGVAYGFLTFQLFNKFLPLFVIVGAPPTILFLLLGLWQRQGQPFESYFLALVNYTFKPRRRLWIKEPIIEAFKIEAPKVVVEQTQRDPRDVRGQLEKLAQLVDTRGWAAKQPEVQEPQLAPTIDLKDRIAQPTAAEPEVRQEPLDIHLSDDILDFKNNPSAQNLNELIEDAERSVREEAQTKMRQKAPAKSSTSGVAQAPSADILKIAMDGGDLKVSHIANQVNRQANLNEGQSVSLRNES
jgi:hypothetical protein